MLANGALRSHVYESVREACFEGAAECDHVPQDGCVDRVLRGSLHHVASVPRDLTARDRRTKHDWQTFTFQAVNIDKLKGNLRVRRCVCLIVYDILGRL